jgi:hypothetical protein
MTEEQGQARSANRVIVKLDPDRFSAETDLETEAMALAAAIPGAQVERVSHTGRVLLNVADDADPVALATELSQRDGVVYAEPDITDHVAAPEG